MSITYCKTCDVVLEGEEITHTSPIDGEVESYCPYCGNPTSELPEDDPMEDR